MSVDSQTVDVTDDLDAFSDEFFGAKVTPEVEDAPPVKEDEEVAEQENIAPTDETDEADPLEEPTDDEDEPEEESSLFKVPKGRKSAKERINELTARAKAAERELEELRAKSTERQEPVKEEKVPTAASTDKDGPDPDALGDDDEPLYPLGEFDPKYIRDLTKFAYAQEREAERAAEKALAEQATLQEQKDALSSAWTEKVTAVVDELPQFAEAVVGLEEQFIDLDPQYGEYLAATIMSLDAGPQVLYYLAQHPEEAQAIAAAGPTRATIALGRLEAQFLGSKVDKVRIKPTAAKTPPPTTRGTGVGRTVKPDTDDLAAFERAFFAKK